MTDPQELADKIYEEFKSDPRELLNFVSRFAAKAIDGIKADYFLYLSNREFLSVAAALKTRDVLEIVLNLVTKFTGDGEFANSVVETIVRKIPVEPDA